MWPLTFHTPGSHSWVQNICRDSRFVIVHHQEGSHDPIRFDSIQPNRTCVSTLAGRHHAGRRRTDDRLESASQPASLFHQRLSDVGRHHQSLAPEDPVTLSSSYCSSEFAHAPNWFLCPTNDCLLAFWNPCCVDNDYPDLVARTISIPRLDRPRRYIVPTGHTRQRCAGPTAQFLDNRRCHFTARSSRQLCAPSRLSHTRSDTFKARDVRT